MNPLTLSEKETAQVTLDKILKQELACLEQAIILLQSESTAIIERDVDTMGHVLDKKLPLLSQLEQLDQQRQAFFVQHSDQTSYQHSAFTQYIKQQALESSRQTWYTIKQRLPECKQQNDLNGRIIQIKKDNTENILQILLGRPVNNTPTYSHLGQTNLQKRSALYTAV